jgi:hypothetical protein
LGEVGHTGTVKEGGRPGRVAQDVATVHQSFRELMAGSAVTFGACCAFPLGQFLLRVAADQEDGSHDEYWAG